MAAGAPPFATPPVLAPAQVVVPETSYAQCHMETGANFPGPVAPANVPDGSPELLAAGAATVAGAAWLSGRGRNIPAPNVEG